MKYKYIGLVILVTASIINLLPENTYSQISAEDFKYSGVAEVSLPSPAAASLAKYGEIPVSYSTGVPSIDIPLYNLSIAQVNLPISLSYHAAGIKASERSGPVGLGWSLNAGGVITRVVRGYPDEINDGVISGYYAQLALMESLAPIGTTSAAEKDYLFKAAEGKYDSEPDLYYYNFAGRSGIMVINSSGGNPSTTEFVSFPDQDLNITYNGTNWKIWDTDGTRYFFNVTENTEGSNNYEANGSNSPGTISRETNEAPYISAWYLQEISHPSSSPNTNTSNPRLLVTFQYEKVAPEGPLEVFSGSSISISKEWDDMSQSCLESTYSDLMVNPQNNSTIKETNARTTLDDHQRLTKIITEEHIVKFTYTDGITNNYPLGYRLERVLVTKRDGTVQNTLFPLKDYTLNYGSFTAGSESLLKLNSISESVLGTNNTLLYSFEYESGSLVSRTDKSLDWLGYPTDRNFGSNDYLIDDDAEFFFLPYPNGVNRDPVLSETKKGVLKKITYPTGGFTEFTYELNNAVINSATVNIGGLRVQKVTSSNDGVSTGFLEKTYTYSGGKVPGELDQLISLGYQILETSTYYPIQGNTSTTCPTMSVTSNLVTPLMGHFVSYDSVTETIYGGNGGKTVYEFEEYGYGGSSSVNHADNFYQRSLPKRTTLYNSSNQKVQETENYYSPQILTGNELYWVRPRVKLNPKIVGGVVQFEKEYQPVYDGYFREYFPNLYKTEVRTFNSSSTTNVVAKTEYYYDQTPDHFEVTKKVLTNSDGEQAEYRYKYANEEYSEMRDENMLVQPYSIELLDPDFSGIQTVAKRWFTWKDFNGSDAGGWNIESIYDLDWQSTDYIIETSPANRTVHVNSFNDLGYPTELTDAVGNKTKYFFGSVAQPFSQNGYDFYNGNYNLKNIYLTGIQKIIGTTDPISGGVRPTSGNDLFTEAIYDDYGRLIEFKDENSNKSEFLYDNYSRLLATIRGNGIEAFHRNYYSSHGNGGSYSNSDPNSVSTFVASNLYDENIIASSKGITTYDGINDVTNFGDVNAFDTPDAFMVSLWFKREEDQSSQTNNQINNVLVANSSENNNDNLEIGTDGTLVEIYLDAGSNSGGSTRDARVEFDAGIQNDTWYHLIITYDHDASGATLNLYLDGEHKKGWNPIDDGVLFTNPLDNSNGSPLTLGLARPAVDKWGDFKGEIVDFYLYDRQFSELELKELYLESITYFDGLGFKLQSQTRGGNKVIATETLYNERGMPEITSRPIEESTSVISGFYSNGLLSGTGTFTHGQATPTSAPVHQYYDNIGTVGDYAYSLTTYEASPLTRAIHSQMPGGANYSSSVEYGLNTTETFHTDAQGSVPAKSWSVNKLNKTTSTDPTGKKNIIYTDAWGNTIASGVDMNGDGKLTRSSTDLVTEFAYDLLGNLVRVEDSRGLTTTYTYNTLSQLVEKKLPDQEYSMKYRYDKAGRLRFSKDPNQQSTKQDISQSLTGGVSVNKTIVVNNDGELSFHFSWVDLYLDNYTISIKRTEDNSTVYSNTLTAEWGSISTQSFNVSPGTYVFTGQAGDPGDIVVTGGTFGFESNDIYTYNLYDDLGRPIETGEYAGGTTFAAADADNDTFPTTGNSANIMYYYDGDQVYSGSLIPQNLKGRLSKVSYRDLSVSSGTMGHTYYSYNTIGLVEWVVQDLPGLSIKKIEYDYDEIGRLTQLSFQGGVSGEQFYQKYSYDELGRLEELESSSDGISWIKEASYTYFADGQVDQVVLGNNSAQTVDYAYTIQGWLDKINNGAISTGTNGDRFGMNLSYSNNGNITQQQWRQVGTSGTNQNQLSYAYSYDNANRLTAANFSGSGYNSAAFDLEWMNYDKNGNITGYLRRNNNGNIGYDGIGYYGLNYETGTNRISQLVEQVDYMNFDIDHDASGNMIKNQMQGFTSVDYDWRNLPAQMVAGSSTLQYAYDADGNRVKKKLTNGVETHYVRGAHGETIAVYEDDVLQFHNILAGSEPIGSWDGSQRRYFLKDHLGSVRTTVDQNGNVDGYDDYYPFGLVMPYRSSSDAGNDHDYRFTGHERDDEAGLTLDYMMARNYDPIIGRFLQIDPLAHEFAGWSPYNYTFNNPLYYTDPTGEGPFPSMAARHLGVAKGLWNSVKSTVSGTVNAVLHPIETAKGLYNAATNPGETYDAISSVVGEKTDQLVNGNPSEQGEVIGEGLGLVGEAVLGTKGAGKLKGLLNVADNASDLASVGKLIDSVGEFTTLKGGVKQGFLTGNADEIFGNLTQGAEKLESGAYKLSDGSIVNLHKSKSTGASTIDINRDGEIYKLRSSEQ